MSPMESKGQSETDTSNGTSTVGSSAEAGRKLEIQDAERSINPHRDTSTQYTPSGGSRGCVGDWIDRPRNYVQPLKDPSCECRVVILGPRPSLECQQSDTQKVRE